MVAPPALQAKYDLDHSAALLLNRGIWVFKKRTRRDDVDFKLLTNTLIDNANQEITSGGEVVRNAEKAISRVIEASNQVNNIMEEISAASREQSNGITQISTAVNEMEYAVQHSVRQLHECASATQRLQHETWQLTNAILAFRTHASGQELEAEIKLAGDSSVRLPQRATTLAR